MTLDDLFYVREALGKSGVPIKVFKFRTMRLDADKEFASLAQEKGLDGIGKIIDDPRVTPLGRILRRYGIDELPQVYNILRGEMAFVGIRPRSESGWAPLPQALKERALRYKPGWFSPRYAIAEQGDFGRMVEIEEGYLDRREGLEREGKSPRALHASYVFRTIYNFLFKGVRSS